MTTGSNLCKLVIIGNGMATGRLLDELASHPEHPFEITVIGDEPHGSYNRIMLSPVLAGETNAEAIIQKPRQWYIDNNVHLISSAAVTQIDRVNRLIQVHGQPSVPYDHIVIATGSRPASIPAKNQQLKNIFSFRTLDDVEAITNSTLDAKHAVVIGGGLLGLEAAYGLACKGVSVTLVHRSQWLLNRQLDEIAGNYLQKEMEGKGINFCLGTETDEFIGKLSDKELPAQEKASQEKVSQVKLTNGLTLPCDLAIIATGISPNKQLGLDAGLACGSAILVDDYMTSSDPRISAIGECCEHEGNTFGLVEPIWQQCKTLAAKLGSAVTLPYSSQPVATKLKVSGVQLFSAGEHLTTSEHRELIFDAPQQGIYRKLLIRENKIVGIVLFGDTRDGQQYFELMQNQTTISNVVNTLIFGSAFYNPETLQTANKPGIKQSELSVEVA